MEELALPTCRIQLSGEVLSTDEVASAELREAEAVHQTRSSHHLFKAAPTTPCICREQQLETGLSNKRLKCMLESYSTAAVRPSRGCSVPRCRTRRRLCGREPPGPDPHPTTLLAKKGTLHKRSRLSVRMSVEIMMLLQLQYFTPIFPQLELNPTCTGLIFKTQCAAFSFTFTSYSLAWSRAKKLITCQTRRFLLTDSRAQKSNLSLSFVTRHLIHISTLLFGCLPD